MTDDTPFLSTGSEDETRVFVRGDGDSSGGSLGVRCPRCLTLTSVGADASLADVARVRYILPVAADFEACWPVLRKHFGTIRPAATMLSAGLADPRIRIEIEVTARMRSGDRLDKS